MGADAVPIENIKYTVSSNLYVGALPSCLSAGLVVRYYFVRLYANRL